MNVNVYKPLCVDIYLYTYTYFLVLSTEKAWVKQYPNNNEHI